MGVMKDFKKAGKTGVIAAALAQLQQEKVKEATSELKALYSRRDKAQKLLKNVEREIQDYLLELEIDEKDAEDNNEPVV